MNWLSRLTAPSALHGAFVVTPWQGDETVAYLRVRRPGSMVNPAALARCLDHLRNDEFRAVMTSAMHPDEAHAYFATGFNEVDSLIVLEHDLGEIPQTLRALPSTISLTTGRRRDRSEVFALDALAFPSNWRLDSEGLREAHRATKRSRLRLAVSSVVTDAINATGATRATAGPNATDATGATTTCLGPAGIAGYAIVGRTGDMAFLQRLATHPSQAGRGIGSALVIDSLEWAVAGRCSTLLVNTQMTNRRALALYEGLGFRRSATRLTVLRCDL